jgi:hypothetical protein
MVEMLNRKRQDLQGQLNDVDAALTALQANPEVVNLLDLIRKVTRY